MFISVTRLRLRRWYTFPEFLWLTLLSSRQARQAPGFRTGFTLMDSRLVFWTMTGWDSEAAMKAYRGKGIHLKAMKKLPGWCDEASVVHWHGDALPDWTEAWRRMQTEGRFTPVAQPSEDQVQRRIAAPRLRPLIQGRV